MQPAYDNKEKMDDTGDIPIGVNRREKRRAQELPPFAKGTRGISNPVSMDRLHVKPSLSAGNPPGPLCERGRTTTYFSVNAYGRYPSFQEEHELENQAMKNEMTTKCYWFVLLVTIGGGGCAENIESSADALNVGDGGEVSWDSLNDVATDTDFEVSATCDADFEVSATTSSAVPTVGIVKWSTTADAEKAYIEFGLDTSYGYVASVDTSITNNRTLLLGMKSNSTYHYRLVLQNGETICGSADYTIETGALSVDVPSVSTTIQDSTAMSSDFIVTASNGYALIIDKDGDVVWWYSFAQDGTRSGSDSLISRVHMSVDGAYMWASKSNVGGGEGELAVVGMDGLDGVQRYTTQGHHDFCVLPDGGIAYISYDDDGIGTCDEIVERTASGTTTTIYRIRDDFADLATASLGDRSSSGSEWCHSNALHYVPDQDAYYISVLNQNMVLKVNRSQKALEWVMDGDGDTVSGLPYLSGVSWNRQHGHQTLDDGSLLLFNNGGGGFSGDSLALRITVNEDGGSAEKIWSYNGDATSSTFGDVQLFSNSNIMVVYSNSGLIHEVSPSDNGGSLVRTLKASGFGYAETRKSLYGLPNRF